MSTFKKTKVVLLTTNEKASLKLGQNGLLVNNTLGYDAHFTNQHLYFLSDEEIKEGDWCVDKHKVVFKQETDKIFSEFTGSKKIIATTDKSLIINSIYGVDSFDTSIFSGSGKSEIVKLPQMFNLPQPSQSFIEKFVEEYNKGNQITEVLVEYEVDDGYMEVKSYLKVNSKDNTITIRKAKDIWNREEVVLFAEKYARMVQEKEIQLNGYKAIHNHKWIEENL